MAEFAREEWMHGFEEFMPGTQVKMLSNSLSITSLYEKRRDHLNEHDVYFWRQLWSAYGTSPFQRGYLDAGRLNRLFLREIVPASESFNPGSREAFLRLIGEPVGSN